MPKHTFSVAYGEDIIGGKSKYKRIKLVRNLDDEEKTITFFHPCIGAYSIRKRNEESFRLWTESAQFSFHEGDYCDSCTDREICHKKNIPLEEVKLKVMLDKDCEYGITVSAHDN